MCSTLTEAGCETTLQALAAGAIPFVTKPRIGLKSFLEDRSNGLVEAVRSAAGANLRAPRGRVPWRRRPPPRDPASCALAEATERVVAIGLPTGGVQSIVVVLRDLDRTTPGIVVVQQMPEKFTTAYAARLDRICDMEVLEARDGPLVNHHRPLVDVLFRSVAPGAADQVVPLQGVSEWIRGAATAAHARAA